jgi:hypothetical protein
LKKKFSKNWHTARHRNEGRGVCQFLLNFFFKIFSNFFEIFRIFEKVLEGSENEKRE